MKDAAKAVMKEEGGRIKDEGKRINVLITIVSSSVSYRVVTSSVSHRACHIERVTSSEVEMRDARTAYVNELQITNVQCIIYKGQWTIKN